MLVPALLSLLALADGPDPAATRGPLVAVEVHGPNEHLAGILAQQALAAAEAAAERVRAWLGASPAEETGSPATIHVYLRPGRFRGLFRRGIAPEEGPERARAQEREAFVDAASRSAHLDLSPRYGEDALKGVGLPGPTLRRAAEAAARLSLLARAPELPEGCLAGLSGAAAQAVLVEVGASAPELLDPWRSSRVAALQRRAEDAPLPDPTTLLAGEPEGFAAEELDLLRTLLVEHLDAPRRLPAALAALEEGGPEALAAVWLGPDPAAAGAAFGAWLAALEAPWDDPSGRSSGPPGALLQVAPDEAEIACWSSEPVERDAYSIRGELLPLSGGRCHFNVLFAGQDGSHLLLNIAREGETYAFAQSGRAWEELQYKPTPPLALGSATPFEVRVGDDRVELYLGGRRVFALALQGHPVRGRWGVGTPARSAWVWRDVRVECQVRHVLGSELVVPVQGYAENRRPKHGVGYLEGQSVLLAPFTPGDVGEGGVCRYRLELQPPWAGTLQYEVRAVPDHPHLSHPYELGLMRTL